MEHRMQLISYLSQNEASDIGIMANSAPVTDEYNALGTLLRAFHYVTSKPLANHSPADRAANILARAAAQVAREYWHNRGC